MKTSPYTILVVDDDYVILDLLTDVLQREGHHVLTTAHGEEAVRICQEQQIQLIILDYMMPGMSGEDVVRALRKFDQDVQIILQTAQDLLPPRKVLREWDIQGYHHKGEKLSKLLLWVDAALKNYDQIYSRRAMESSLLALGLALEARDLETAGHTKRVVKMAERIGRNLGLNHLRLEALRQGAYLHDLGKLCIPDAVLLKPDRLNNHEYAIMKTHAQRGYELAANIPGVKPEALEVIQYHHECWNGAGYPHGLHGDKIPLLARIFTICDVFDALVSARTYKLPWSEVDAIAELQKQCGSQFAPDVTDIFVTMWRNAAFTDLYHHNSEIPASPVAAVSPQFVIPHLAATPSFSTSFG